MLQLRHRHVLPFEGSARESPRSFAPTTDLFLSKELFVGHVSLRIDVSDLPIVKDPDFARTIEACVLSVYFRQDDPAAILLDHLDVPELLVFNIEKLDKPDPELSP